MSCQDTSNLIAPTQVSKDLFGKFIEQDTELAPRHGTELISNYALILTALLFVQFNCLRLTLGWGQR